MKKVRIALFTYLPLEQGGGLAMFYQTIATLLSRRYPNLSFTVVTLSPRFADKITRIYSVYYLRREKQPSIRHTGSRTYRYVQAKNFPHLTRTLASFDIVYGKNDIMDLLLLAAAGYSHIKKLIIGFHTPVQYHLTPTIQSKMHNVIYDSQLYRKLLSNADAFHVLNSYHEQAVRKMVSNTPVYHIANPVKSETVGKKGNIVRLSSGPIRILWIGRLTQDKGADDLIWLIRNLHTASHRKFEWTVVGDGALYDELEKVRAELPGITTFRALPHHQVLPRYSSHDALLMTSKWECFPYVVLEAQRAGLPVIAYDIPGCSDIVQDGTTGTLATSRSHMKQILNSFRRYHPKRKLLIRQSTARRFRNAAIVRQLYNLFTSTHEKKPLR